VVDEKDIRRIDDPTDFVRREVEALLTTSIPVIPCLVSHAQLPGGDELPESVRPLLMREGMAVCDPSLSELPRQARLLQHRIRRVGFFGTLCRFAGSALHGSHKSDSEDRHHVPAFTPQGVGAPTCSSDLGPGRGIIESEGGHGAREGSG
jgi:hypothetical protein